MFPISIKKRNRSINTAFDRGQLKVTASEGDAGIPPGRAAGSSRRAQLNVRPQTQGSTFQEQRHSPEAELRQGRAIQLTGEGRSPGVGRLGRLRALETGKKAALEPRRNSGAPDHLAAHPAGPLGSPSPQAAHLQEGRAHAGPASPLSTESPRGPGGSEAAGKPDTLPRHLGGNRGVKGEYLLLCVRTRRNTRE